MCTCANTAIHSDTDMQLVCPLGWVLLLECVSLVTSEIFIPAAADQVSAS